MSLLVVGYAGMRVTDDGSIKHPTHSLSSPLKSCVRLGRARLAICTTCGPPRGIEEEEEEEACGAIWNLGWCEGSRVR